jgi:3-isopropylmalate/(R)-2-methylmalate dehydratase small subunit
MIEGVVHTLGRDINTDLISSAKYFSGGSGTYEQKLRYTLYDYDPNFGAEYMPGTILVASENFGCGSSREIAAKVFKDLHVPAILAETFARTFYRNSINIGLPIFEVPNVSQMFENGQAARINPETGLIENLATGKSVQIPPMPPEIQKLIGLGGLMPFAAEQLKAKQNNEC